jgi:hypothetical protein
MFQFTSSVLSSDTCDFASYHHAPKRRTVRLIAALLAIPLLLALGFSIVWMHLVRNSAVKIVKTSTKTANSETKDTASIAALPMTGDVFLQFSTSGTILENYTPGRSLWLRTLYHGNSTEAGTQLSDFKSAGVNAFEDGGFYPYVPNDISNWGCGSGSSFSVSCYHTQWQNITWSYRLNEFNSTGIPFVIRTDNILNPPSWFYPAIVDMNQQLMSLGPQLGMIVTQLGPDEFPNTNFGTYYACGWGNQLDGLGLGFTGDSTCGSFTPTGISSSPFAHIPFGANPFFFSNPTTLYEWLNEPTVSDFSALEATGGDTTTASLSEDQQADQIVANVAATRGAVPSYLEARCDGPGYYKKTNDTQYTPGVDLLEHSAEPPGDIPDQVFYAVAHGYAAIRFYELDHVNIVNPRKNDPICTTSDGSGCNLEQTGCAPISMHSSIGSLGQDRWYALSAAYNLVKLLEPYVLQPAMTAPVCTSPVICGAKQGNGSRLVVFVNYSDTPNSVTYNPSQYVFAGGAAQSWKIVGSDNPGCGAESTLPSVNDCGIGPTTINGVTWTQGSVMPPPGSAPVTTTTLSMQPLEVDVFLYT